MVFFLLHLFALKNCILRRVYRLHQKGSRSISQKTGRTLPLRSKKKEKGRDSFDKVSQLHNFALGKKAAAPL